MKTRSRSWIVLAVLTIAVLWTLQWSYQEKLFSHVSKIQTTIDAMALAITPLSPVKNIDLRKHFILDQMGQASEGHVLFVGDSIIEGIYFPKLGNKTVINGGMGGGFLTYVTF